MRANLREIARAAENDPKQAIMDAVGDLDDYECFHNLVLVATYIGPEKTKGGIILADRSIAENRFQGKVGLVLKVGPLAFKDDNIAKFGGVTVSPGDWVVYRPSDGIEHFVKDSRTVNDGVPCRLIEDAHIKGRVSDPAAVY